MTAQFVDPHRHLELEGRRYGVLAVGPPGQQCVLGPLGQVGQREEQGGKLPEEKLVDPAQDEKLTCLCNVLGSGAPVDISAGVPVADPVQLPHQRHQRVTRTGEAGPDGIHVQIVELRFAAYLGRRRRDDRQRGLDVEPRLEARFLREQRSHTGFV